MSESENFKRTERLASAVYLITGFFNDKDPLKWELRGIVTRLVSVYSSEAGPFKTDKTFSGTHELVREMLTLLSVGRSAGLISEMNHDLIVSEFSRFEEALGRSSQALENLLSAPISPSKPERIAEARKEESRAAEPAQPVESIKDRSYEAPKELPEGLLPAVSVERPKKTENLKGFGAVAVKKNSRQSVIISLLKRKKEIMIKDVSPLIEGVSEKTIQRELLSMVKAGILTKVGEKRWSRYSLA